MTKRIHNPTTGRVMLASLTNVECLEANQITKSTYEDAILEKNEEVQQLKSQGLIAIVDASFVPPSNPQTSDEILQETALQDDASGPGEETTDDFYGSLETASTARSVDLIQKIEVLLKELKAQVGSIPESSPSTPVPPKLIKPVVTLEKKIVAAAKASTPAPVEDETVGFDANLPIPEYPGLKEYLSLTPTQRQQVVTVTNDVGFLRMIERTDKEARIRGNASKRVRALEQIMNRGVAELGGVK